MNLHALSARPAAVRAGRGAFAVLCLLAGFVAVSPPVEAQPILYRIAQFRAQTPACDQNPTFAWVGRVSGQSDNNWGSGSIPVSLVGCFQTEQACNSWRMLAIGLVDGEIIQNSCRKRSIP